MKYWILILFILITFKSQGQNKVPEIWTVDQLLNIGLKKGISELAKITDPINLLYIDSTLSKKIIDIEFKSSFYERREDSVGIYNYNLPEVTKRIADEFDDRYALDKLYIYYNKLPKFIKSDTVFLIYNCIDEYLLTLIYYKPNGLKDKLKSDYNDWRKISKRAPIKKYPDIRAKKSINFQESIKLKKSDLYPDCNFIILKLAYALKLLNEPGFDDKLISQLRLNQTYPFIRRYEFPKSIYHHVYETQSKKIIIKLPKLYKDLGEFVKDTKEFNKVTMQGVKNYSDIIIYGKNNKGYMETSFSDGSAGFIIALMKNSLIIENIWTIDE